MVAPLSCLPVRSRTAQYRQLRDDVRRRRERFQPKSKDARGMLKQTLLASAQRNVRDQNGQRDVELVPFKVADDAEQIDVTLAARPQWTVDLDAAQCGLETLQEKIDALQRFQRRQSANVFHNSTTANQQQVAQLANEVSRTIQDVENRLRKLTALSPSNDQSSRRIRTNASSAVAKQLQALSRTFRRSQSHYVEELERQQGDRSIVGEVTTPAEAEIMVGRQLATVVDQSVGVRRNRESAIEKIGQTMEEIQLMFQETSRMVIEQGSMLDRIDVNVERTVEGVGRGNRVLHQIQHRQRKGIAKQAFVILFVTDCILLSLVILKFWFWPHHGRLWF